MEPQTIIFSTDHLDEQDQLLHSADLRRANLHTGALLFLSSALAVFAVMTTRHLPILWDEMAMGKLIAVIGFNLFAGYMLVDAFCELWRLCRLH